MLTYPRAICRRSPTCLWARCSAFVGNVNVEKQGYVVPCVLIQVPCLCSWIHGAGQWSCEQELTFPISAVGIVFWTEVRGHPCKRQVQFHVSYVGWCYVHSSVGYWLFPILKIKSCVICLKRWRGGSRPRASCFLCVYFNHKITFPTNFTHKNAWVWTHKIGDTNLDAVLRHLWSFLLLFPTFGALGKVWWDLISSKSVNYNS